MFLFLFFLVFGRGRTCPRLKLIGFLCFAFCFYSFCFPQSFPSVFLVFAFRAVFILVLPCFWVRYDLFAFKTDWIFQFCLMFLFLLFSPIFSFCFLVFRVSWYFYTCSSLFLGEVRPVAVTNGFGFSIFPPAYFSLWFCPSFPCVFLFFLFRDVFFFFFVVFCSGTTCPCLKLVRFFHFGFCLFPFCFPPSFPCVFLFFLFRDVFFFFFVSFQVRPVPVLNWFDFSILPSA